MIDTNEFAKIREELEKDDLEREEIIKRSRDIIKDSKVAIYSIHRNDPETSEKKISDMKTKISELPDDAQYVGIKEVAVQEYVEAAALLCFFRERRLITMKELDVEKEPYLLGVCDLTGELMRMAVNMAISGECETVIVIRDIISGIYGEFLQMNLPNSELRKKSDSIKWNLNKVEDLVLEIKMKNER